MGSCQMLLTSSGCARSAGWHQRLPAWPGRKFWFLISRTTCFITRLSDRIKVQWMRVKRSARIFVVLGRLFFSPRFQSEVHQDPDRNCKEDDCYDPVPRPIKIVGLNREDRNHEIIAEPRVAEKTAAGRKFFAKAAD